MKIFSYDNAENTLKVAYKIKVPQEISCLDISSDGVHYSLGLSTGQLLIKSKSLTSSPDDPTPEQHLLNTALVSTWKSNAKNYKYFYRGQYLNTQPDEQRKDKLQPFEQSLRQFKYREALLLAESDDVMLAVVEELVQRGALE